MVRRDDPSNDAAVIEDLVRRVRRMELSPQIGNTAVDSGALVVKSVEGFRVEGSAVVIGLLDGEGHLVWSGPIDFTGAFSNTGPFTNSGTFTNSGDLTNTGKLVQNGAADLNGAVKIAGTTTITGVTELQSDLNVTGGGKIKSGSVVIDGTSGGRVAAPAATLALVGDTGITMTGNVTVRNNMLVEGAFTVLGAKAFGIEHPHKPGVMLRHAATESPISAIEYFGEAVLDGDGNATVELPDYFDALAKPDGRTVFVTGRGFPPDWSDIDTNTFTVTGTPGGRFSWQVKAERFGGDFELEQPMPEPSEPQEA